jgi:hypothetical protein
MVLLPGGTGHFPKKKEIPRQEQEMWSACDTLYYSGTDTAIW